MGSLHPRRAQLRPHFHRNNAWCPACTTRVKGPFCSNCPAPQRGYTTMNANTATSARGASSASPHCATFHPHGQHCCFVISQAYSERRSSSHTKQRNIIFLLSSSQHVHQALQQNLLDVYSHLTLTAAIPDNNRQSQDFQNPEETT